MVTIENLNRRQVEILTMIWNCKTEEEFLAVVETLPPEDQQQCRTMLHFLITEIQENKLQLTQDYTEANAILANFMK